MHESLCERCGSAATVTVGWVRSHRAGEAVRAGTAHRYCRDCAREAGVPIPQRTHDASGLAEPELTSWSEVEQYLAQYEQIIQEQPDIREQVMELARRLWHYADQIPGTMPSAVVQAFARVGANRPE